MPTKFRYVAVAPGRIEDRKQIGPASYLHDFLVDHQTDAEGNVRYGKAISYAWIRSKWAAAPPLRTLKRHMGRLKGAGCVQITRLPFHDGMLVRVVGSAKWAPEAAQMRLFPLAEPVSISGNRSGKAVSKLSNSPAVAQKSGATFGTAAVPLLALKSSKNIREEKFYGEPLAVARSSPVEEEKALADRRRLLAEQAVIVLAKYKTSCG